MYDEVLERNSDGELEVRVVQASGDNNPNADDVFTRDDDGKLALRVTGVGGGGGAGGITKVVHDDTLVGNGTTASPLKVADSITDVIPESASSGNQLVTEYDLMQHSELPPQTGNEGKILSTNGSTPQWIDAPTSGSGGDDGLRGDYCCRYGVVAWPNGSPSIGTGNTVNIPAGLVLNVPGTVANPSTSLITLASAQTVTLTKTTNSLLVYVQGLDEIQQCDKICFSKTTPVDDDSTCQLWWNGQEMQFRSTDQGNIWVAVRAGILGELLYTEGSLTRINRVGWYHYLPETTGA